MEIIAKFDKACPKCNQLIRTGEKCEWPGKGAAAYHIVCPGNQPVANGQPKSDNTMAQLVIYLAQEVALLKDRITKLEVAAEAPKPARLRQLKRT